MPYFRPKALPLCLLPFLSMTALAQTQSPSNDGLPTVELEHEVITAQRQVKQSLGVSNITESDLERTPVASDISEIVRKMPGVNLTGNSVGGARGNNRQIDIRGMGPENTLILVDGKPISSRQAVRYSWQGERDTRGDSQWVPAGAIKSIEVIRGPAAARYGSGAMGGVVNIVTKAVSEDLTGATEVFTNQPEDSKEGGNYRVNASLSGAILPEKLGFRVYGGYNKSEADDADLNPSNGSSRPAGREGVENKDVGLRLAYQINADHRLTLDTDYGRQGNLYAGDVQNSNADASATNNATNALLNQLIGQETNTMKRQHYALTHDVDWANGMSSKITAQFDKTDNTRYTEGLAGGPEGRILPSQEKKTTTLKTQRLDGEVSIPMSFKFPQMLTLGASWVEDDLHDPASTVQLDNTIGNSLVPLPSDRTNANSRIFSLFAENNIGLTDTTNLVLALRYDHHNKSGSNLSPAINLTQQIGENWTIKGGVARAYKTPNLYQTAEGYLLYTNGHGCPLVYTLNNQTITATGALNTAGTLDACYLMANPNLKPETSVNSELGVQYKKDHLNASLTYFRNDYKNKIAAGDTVLAQAQARNNAGRIVTSNLLQWENIPEALIEGMEGSVSLDYGNIMWTNNLTYMINSKNKQTGNALSIIPEYTWNSLLTYYPNDNLDIGINYTHYGKQQPRQYAETNLHTNNPGRSGLNTTSVKGYGIVGINAGYHFNDNLSGRIGINNLFDKQLLRDNTTNQTYNEAGRSYFASLKYTF